MFKQDEELFQGQELQPLFFFWLKLGRHQLFDSAATVSSVAEKNQLWNARPQPMDDLIGFVLGIAIIAAAPLGDGRLSIRGLGAGALLWALTAAGAHFAWQGERGKAALLALPMAILFRACWCSVLTAVQALLCSKHILMLPAITLSAICLPV